MPLLARLLPAPLEHESGKSSYGVAPPVGVVVDLDSVRTAPARLVRSGIGDAVSNLSAIADWELAAADLGEPTDGLAVTLARAAAQAVLHQPGTTDSDEYRTVLAEALILSGMAMTVAGSSRPCSGGDHEIMHAIDQLYPGTGTHGELARARRLAAALRVHRAIQAVELSLLILAAAVADALRGGLMATRVLAVACLVIAGVMVPAHLVSILASRRLR